MALTKITNSAIADDIGLGGNPTTSTQTAGNSTTRIATTAFVSTAVANLVDSSPATLNTLNELAAAIGDDATFSSTITTSIATKLPLAGGALTGAVTTNSTFDGVDIAARDAVLTSTTTTAGAALPKAGGTMTGGLSGTTGTFSGAVTANGGVVVDNFTLDGTTLALSSGDFTLDVAGYINLDSDGGKISFKDGGTLVMEIEKTSSDVRFYSAVSDNDINFLGNDGGSTITALTLDMSAAGAATFNSHIKSSAGYVILGSSSDFQIFHDESATNFIKSNTSDHDLIIQGNDGGSIINALSFDMSAAGAATFSGDVSVPNISVADDIRHTGDSDTYISFEANNQTYYSGGTRALDLASGSAVFNEGGGDVDFRVEAVNSSHALFVEGSSGNVGIGIASPSSKLHVYHSTNASDTLLMVDNRQTSQSGADYNKYGIQGIARGSDASWSRGVGISGMADAATFHKAIGVYAGLTTSPASGFSYDTALFADGNNLGYAGTFMNGNVGIGTTNPDYKLSIHGGASSVATGPHIQATTTDDSYPVFQQLNWYHDNVSLNFDSYYDGAWKSADAGSNFQIYKLSDKFQIRYDSGIAAGSAVTWNEGFVMDTSGNVGISTIPNSGGHSSWANLSMGTKGSLISSTGAGGIYGMLVTDNLYIPAATGSFAYRTTNEASYYMQEAGEHRWYNAPSGSAGATATLTEHMRIDSSGNVKIHTPITNAFFGLSLQYNNTDTADFKVNQATGQIKIGGSATNYYPTFWSSGTERMRIDSSGNVGINVTSPAAKFHASQTYSAPTNGISADTVGIFSKSNTANGNANVSVLSRSSGEARLYLGDETDENKWAIISKSYGGGLSFESAGTERLRIATNARQTINGSATATGHGNFVGEVGSSYKAIMFEHTVGGGETGSITTGASSTAYNTSSDYRLKENVVPMTGSIDRVKALKPSRFNFISESDRTVDGFLAHEAQEIVPECVTGTKDAMRDEEYEVTAAVEEVRDEDDNVTTEAVEAVMGTRSVPDMQGIDQAKLVPLLTAALQEAIARIEILEAGV
jgi:hypothetical protein